MPINNQSLNRKLYDLLRSNGHNPKSLDIYGEVIPVPDEAEVFKITYSENNQPIGPAWLTIDNKNLVIYYDDQLVKNSETDNWTKFLQHMKNWAQRKQLGFELENKDHLSSDMAKRKYLKEKEEITESAKLLQDMHKLVEIAEIAKNRKEGINEGDEVWWPKNHKNKKLIGWVAEGVYSKYGKIKFNANLQEMTTKNTLIIEFNEVDVVSKKAINGDKNMKNTYVKEGYYPITKNTSYNDSIPTIKIVLQHSRQIQENEQRYRNIAKIFLENEQGERILAPTKRPGIAQIYARHLAEGGLPHDDHWKHINSLVEEYQKMAGFARAIRNKQFNESAQSLVETGLNHYQSIKETLSKMRSHRGYTTYFESYTPQLMETENDDSNSVNLNELFVQETLDPRIESVMPILSKLSKNLGENKEVKELENWADQIIVDSMDITEFNDMTMKAIMGEGSLNERKLKVKNPVAKFSGKTTKGSGKHKVKTKTIPRKAKHKAKTYEEKKVEENVTINKPDIISRPKTNLPSREDYIARRKEIQRIQMDPETSKDPLMKKALIKKKAELDIIARQLGITE